MNKQNNPHRNRLAGEYFERYVIKKFKEKKLFPPLGRTQEVNPDLDALGIDLTPIGDKDQLFNYNVQCKNTTKTPAFLELLSRVSEVSRIPIVFHRKTKSDGSSRFVTEGETATLFLDDFMTLLTTLESYKKRNSLYEERFDSMDPEAQRTLSKKLLKLPT